MRSAVLFYVGVHIQPVLLGRQQRLRGDHAIKVTVMCTACMLLAWCSTAENKPKRRNIKKHPNMLSSSLVKARSSNDEYMHLQGKLLPRKTGLNRDRIDKTGWMDIATVCS